MIKADNIVRVKSEDFAIAVVNTYRFLAQTKNEFILSKQFLKSGTSIGANIAESECASSENDFVNKLYIALKECNETLYWLNLLYKTEYIDEKMYESLFNDCSEIKRILTSSVKTIRDRQSRVLSKIIFRYFTMQRFALPPQFIIQHSKFKIK